MEFIINTISKVVIGSLYIENLALEMVRSYQASSNRYPTLLASLLDG